MKYRFVSVWAAFHVVLGSLIVAGSLVVAGALVVRAVPAGVLPIVAGWEPLMALAAVLAGLFVGAPFIVSGQLLQVFLDQRRLLGRIHGRLRQLERLQRERDESELALRRHAARRGP